MLKSLFATAAALAALWVGPAHAGTKLKGVDLKPLTGPFAGGPRIAVEFKNGKLAIADGPVYVGVRTGGHIDNVSKKYSIFVADVFVQDIWGKGADYPLTPRNLQFGDGIRGIDGNRTLYFTKANLGPLAKQALDICSAHPGSEPKSYGIDFPLTLTVKAGREYYDGHRDIVTREASTIVHGDVMCPAKPQRTKVPPQRTPVPPKVLSANLAIVNGIGKACPKKVFLVATFETDHAGSFDILLRRSDGETDRKTITAEKKAGKFIARFDRTYEFNSDVRRKYMVEVVGMPKASAWVPMTVNCGGPGAAGAKGGLTLK